MTRELNVRITLSDGKRQLSDVEYEEIIQEGIYALTDDCRVCVEVETVKPESEKK